MPLQQSIDLARGLIDQAAFDAALSRAATALKWLRERHADGKLPLLRYANRPDDLQLIKDTGRRLADGATDVVFLGTGGSSLGGQTLAQLAGYGVPGVGVVRAPARLPFLDKLHPLRFWE